MRTVRLVALSDDGTSLILAADGPDGIDGVERFELPIDDRLRAAARGDAQRLGRLEVDLGASLPPRVIQARIRAGETPEQVAQSSGTPVERIVHFAHPVLQERARIAERAREARVRLSDGVPGAPLERFVTERLRLVDGDVAPVAWDAHRGDDGAWLVTATWRAGHASGTTRWSYDIPARTVAPLDAATTDFAEGTRLVRVVPDVPAQPAAASGRRGRSVAVIPDGAPTGSPGSPPGRGGGGQAADEHPTDVVPVHSAPGTAVPDPFLDHDAGDLDLAEHDTVVLGRSSGDVEDEDPRAVVPAWEDIVFGVRRHR